MTKITFPAVLAVALALPVHADMLDELAKAVPEVEAMIREGTIGDWRAARPIVKEGFAIRVGNMPDVTHNRVTGQQIVDCINGSLPGAAADQRVAVVMGACVAQIEQQQKANTDASVAAASSQPLPAHDKLIGAWMFVRSRSHPERVIIFERKGILMMQLGIDGSDLEFELVSKRKGKQIDYREKEPTDDPGVDLHWRLSSDGTLEWRSYGKTSHTSPRLAMGAGR